MIVLNLRVIAQGIEVLSSSELVSRSVNIYDAVFEFNSDWEGFTKTVVYQLNSNPDPVEIVMTGDTCVVPPEAVEVHGILRIGVYGTNGTQVMPTVWTNALLVKEGTTTGSVYIEPTETTYEQVMELLAGIGGGRDGQILAKLSDIDYDFKWVDNPARYVDGEPGNIVVIDNNENIADSGVGKDNLILSPQLNSHIYAEDQTPYIYRQTGGGVEAGTREWDSIVGGSVVNHQYVKALSSADWQSEGGVTVSYSADNEATVSSTTISNGIHTRYSGAAVVNHIYYLAAYLYSANTYNNICFGRASRTSVFANNWSTVANTWKLNTSLRRATSAATSPIYFYCTNTGGYQDVKVKDPMIIDLTEMLGSTVAEYIFTNEHPSDILRKIGLNQYRPYTAEPSLLSAMPTAHKMVGFNRFDKTKVSAGKWLSTTTGLEENSQSYTATDYIRVFGGVPVYIPNTESARRWFYSLDKTPVQYLAQSSEQIFTPPTDGYIRASIHTAESGAKNLDEICINISDPVRNGTYEPYEEHTYPLDSSLTLRGVAVTDANGNIKFDGDEYAPDGTVTRRYGIVDLGTLTWTTGGTGRHVTNMPNAKPHQNTEIAYAICSKYGVVTGNGIASSDMSIAVGMNNSVQTIINDSTLNGTDAATFKAAMSGVYLIYERTPTAYTVETATPYDALQICDPLGTEEYVDERPVPVPVGHVTKYPVDQVRKLDGLPSDFTTLLAYKENEFKATRTYTKYDFITINNVLYEVTATTIASGTALTVGSNITQTTVGNVLKQILSSI